MGENKGKPVGAVNEMFNRMSKIPMGERLVSAIVCWKAPYFSSIRPKVVALSHGHCEVVMKKRRAVTNHIGTVHAIAMCNMCELAGGLAIESCIPATLRWIPKGMNVQYLKKAETDLKAVCDIDWSDWGHGQEVPLIVHVTDTHNERVMTATINVWVTQK